jgi:hypothetical protein
MLGDWPRSLRPPGNSNDLKYAGLAESSMRDHSSRESQSDYRALQRVCRVKREFGRNWHWDRHSAEELGHTAWVCRSPFELRPDSFESLFHAGSSEFSAEEKTRQATILRKAPISIVDVYLVYPAVIPVPLRQATTLTVRDRAVRMLSWTSSWELMVERLVLEWKVTHGKWDEKRDGLYDKSKEKPPAYFDCLLC